MTLSFKLQKRQHRYDRYISSIQDACWEVSASSIHGSIKAIGVTAFCRASSVDCFCLLLDLGKEHKNEVHVESFFCGAKFQQVDLQNSGLWLWVVFIPCTMCFWHIDGPKGFVFDINFTWSQLSTKTCRVLGDGDVNSHSNQETFPKVEPKHCEWLLLCQTNCHLGVGSDFIHFTIRCDTADAWVVPFSPSNYSGNKEVSCLPLAVDAHSYPSCKRIRMNQTWSMSSWKKTTGGLLWS